jgi:hypothetical protein
MCDAIEQQAFTSITVQKLIMFLSPWDGHHVILHREHIRNGPAADQSNFCMGITMSVEVTSESLSPVLIMVTSQNTTQPEILGLGLGLHLLLSATL